MFDPSKLNLDLEDKQNKEINGDQKKEKNEDILDNIEVIDNKAEENKLTKNNKKTISENKKDDSDNISIIKNENTDNKKIEEKKEIKEVENKKNNEEVKKNEEKNNKIYDINITSIQNILELIIKNEYDFVVFEPSEENVKITFRKDKLIKDTRYIKYPIYSQILIKAKQITNLVVEETNEIQEGNGDINLNNKSYKVISRTVPENNLGEKLFLKTKEIQKKHVHKNKKTSIKQILGFLGAIVFIAFVVGGAFTSFVVINARTVEDVKFFYSLGINLNDINTFIKRIVTIIFSTLFFIETIFLIIYLFKFSLTKKQFRPKKIKYGIIASLFLIITLITASIWMVIDRKVNALPNWLEQSYGDIQIYDNSKLLSDQFSKGGSLINDTKNIIGPVEIKFDLSNFANTEKEQGFTIQKYIWNFGIDGEDIIETPNSTIIKKFTKKGNYELSLFVEEIDLKGDIIEKKIDDIPNINLSYIVEKTEEKTNNGGKFISFDASSLKELGKVEWYFMDDLNTPVWTGEIFNVGKAIFEETLIGMYIRREDKESETLDKIFIISGEDEIVLDGDIIYNISLENNLEVDFMVNNTNLDFGNGYIKEYKWIIEKKEFTLEGDYDNPSESSKITYEFSNYGEHTIKVILKDSSGNTKEITNVVEIPKQLKMNRLLVISNNGEEIEDYNYEAKLNEYYLGEIGTPTELELDARRVKGDNLLYILKEVNWDFDSNGDIDDTSKLTTYNINTEGSHQISVEYVFQHIKLTDEIIRVNENIFFEAIKKEAIINFEIINDTNYTPVVVQFDASKSTVKDDDIIKFIWDYGDGITEERDSIVPGHKYLTPGDYTIKLKVVTENGKEYEISKKLILKPKPQSVNITSSMKKTVVNQAIDFNSSNSEGQIISYLWDFGDGSKSTEPNPSHSYSKAGNYTVTLKVDFSNNNIMEDTVEIEIFKDY